MNPQEIITIADHTITLFISTNVPSVHEEIQTVIRANGINYIPEGFIPLTNNKDIINITLKSINSPTNEVEIIESPINTLWTEKNTTSLVGKGINEKLEEKKTNASIIEESTTSTFGWLFNLPYIGIKKIFNPIKDFIFSFFWTPVSSTSDELKSPIQALNSELDATEESISQEEQNRILDEVLLSNTIVANNQQEHLSDIKGKKEYKAPEVSNWACLVHIDVITKLYDLLVDQQHSAFAKIQENSVGVQGRDFNLWSEEDLKIKEQLDKLTSEKTPNKKDEKILIHNKISIIENNQANLADSKGKEEFKEIKSSEFYVPSTHLIMPQKCNLNLIEQQLPLVEDRGQSSDSHVVNSNRDKPNGVFIELPYRDTSSVWNQTYNSVIFKEAESLRAKNNIIKDLVDGVFTFTDTNLNKLLSCVGRQLSQDPEIQKQTDFKLDVFVLRQYFNIRTTESLAKGPLNNLPVSIVEIVELMHQFKQADIFFPIINQKEHQYFNGVYEQVAEKVYGDFNKEKIKLNKYA